MNSFFLLHGSGFASIVATYFPGLAPSSQEVYQFVTSVATGSVLYNVGHLWPVATRPALSNVGHLWPMVTGLALSNVEATGPALSSVGHLWPMATGPALSNVGHLWPLVTGPAFSSVGHLWPMVTGPALSSVGHLWSMVTGPALSSVGHLWPDKKGNNTILISTRNLTKMFVNMHNREKLINDTKINYFIYEHNIPVYLTLFYTK